MAHVALAIVVAGVAAMSSPVHAGRSSSTPVQKVVEMLNGLILKGEAEKHAEELEFAKSETWCKSEEAQLTRNIETAAAEIEELTADIAKAGSDVESLGAELETLAGEIASHEKEHINATSQRATQHADYKAAHKDVSESIDAIGRAIAELKAQNASVPQNTSTSLIQISKSRFIDSQSKALMQSFVGLDEGVSDAAPEANAYEFQSGGIVDLLEKLLIKFKDQKTTLETEERNARSNFDLLSQGLTNEISSLKDTEESKTKIKAARKGEAAKKTGEMTVKSKGKASDESSLSDTQAQCMSKDKEYKQNQAMRTDELTAITKAIEILSSERVSGNADKYLPAADLIQETSIALAQLRSTLGRSDGRDAARRIAVFLESRAQQVNSKYLELVAVRMQADPFVKVKQMIKELIVKLMEEANSEQDRHSYCQTELATNALTREGKSSEVEQLTAKLDQTEAESQQLKSAIADLGEVMVAITKSQQEAAKIRSESKATHATTIADAKDAQMAVSKAIEVLKDFYQPGGGAALLQAASSSESVTEEMTQVTDGEPYSGMASSGSTIISMLDVIMSDFARLQAETETAEDTDKAAHTKFMNESNEDLAVKKAEQDHLAGNYDKAVQEIRFLTKELDSTKIEMSAAVNYYDKLKADCVDTGLSYEDRVQKREEEIKSLQEALEMLAAES